MTDNPLLHPVALGALALQHRIVMAPMTRIRADRDTLAPTRDNADYYSQRASEGGLIITEAVHISPEGTPIWTIYQNVRDDGGQVPGIWTGTQRDGWRDVVSAVHARKGLIVCQLLHAGRIAQPEIGDHPVAADSDLPLPSVSASAIALPQGDEDSHYDWDQPNTQPRALATAEMRRICDDYAHAARNARDAGFDAVELHAAHGYLIDQFLNQSTNHRDDMYGGSLENRCRLLFEVTATLIDVMGKGRVGVRLSPYLNDPQTGTPSATYFGAQSDDAEAVYSHAVRGLNDFDLAYLLLTEPRVGGGLASDPKSDQGFKHPLSLRHYRTLYNGTLMGAGGFTPITAATAITQNAYDLIAFGRWFISNPDLPDRIRHGHDLTVYDRATFYSGSTAGYTDYPDSHDSAKAAGYRMIAVSDVGASLPKADPQAKTYK